MIDLHTHTLLSDGELLPSELVRRAEMKGYEAIALTDHVDASNMDFVLPRVVKACRSINKFWKITALPGVEITHVPLQEIKPLVKYARKNGAKITIVHGETMSEPVLPGTNRCGIEAGCDILAHPGMIKREDVELAKKKGIYLELTTRKNHLAANEHVCRLGLTIGTKLVLNNDAHAADDLVSADEATRFLLKLGLEEAALKEVFQNSKVIVKRLRYNQR
jgi:histidinol phosphatase-like PHP family hydrolase